MKLWVRLLVLAVSVGMICIGGVTSSQASGLNGTTIWGIGSVASQMAGTGTAMPLESLTANLKNPAGLAFFDQAMINLDLTLINPEFTSEWDGLGPNNKPDERRYPLPNFGVALPMSKFSKGSPLSFGFALGVTAGGGDNWMTNTPLPVGVNALYEVFSTVFNVSYKITDNLSIGVGPRLNWALMDLGAGHSLDPALGAQVGVIYNTSEWSFGASYIPKTSFQFSHVLNLTAVGGGVYPIEIQEPDQVYAGISWHPSKALIVNLDGRYIGYEHADFYKQIGWKDMYGVAVGAQYQLLPTLKVRAGYTYNTSVLEGKDGWNPAGTTDLPGGAPAPNLVVEAARMMLLPLYWQHHVGAGIGWDVLPGVTINLGGTYSFETSEKDQSAAPGLAAGCKTKFWTVDAGFQFQF